MTRWEVKFNPDGTVEWMKNALPLTRPRAMRPVIGRSLGFVSAEDELAALALAVTEWRKLYAQVDTTYQGW